MTYRQRNKLETNMGRLITGFIDNQYLINQGIAKLFIIFRLLLI